MDKKVCNTRNLAHCCLQATRMTGNKCLLYRADWTWTYKIIPVKHRANHSTKSLLPLYLNGYYVFMAGSAMILCVYLAILCTPHRAARRVISKTTKAASSWKFLETHYPSNGVGLCKCFGMAAFAVSASLQQDKTQIRPFCMDDHQGFAKDIREVQNKQSNPTTDHQQKIPNLKSSTIPLLLTFLSMNSISQRPHVKAIQQLNRVQSI